MKKINLRELYPDVYTTDFFIDVTEEVVETIRAAERAEAAYERKMYRYKAQYSLDCENGIEKMCIRDSCWRSDRRVFGQGNFEEAFCKGGHCLMKPELLLSCLLYTSRCV